MKATCGDKTTFTMTTNTPRRTVGTLLLTKERMRDRGIDAEEEKRQGRHMNGESAELRRRE